MCFNSRSEMHHLVWIFWMLHLIAFIVGELSERNYLLQQLSNYSKDELPSENTGKPVEVRVKVIIHSIDTISEASMDFTTTIYLRQWWLDTRLSYPSKNTSTPIQLAVSTIEKIWVPDVYFVNEKRASYHMITLPNKLMHIYPDGTVFYSVRLSLTLSCFMNLRKYPMDSQICPIYLESYSYLTNKLILLWNHTKPVEMDGELQLPNFHLSGLTSSDCTKMYNEVGNFTCIRADVWLYRQVGYYLIQIYIPNILIVVLSWVSFWINVDAVPARISLGVLTVLTITTQTSGISSTLPKVSYIKALDIWMALCLIFVFGAVLEFAIVNIYVRGGKVNVISKGRKLINSTIRKRTTSKSTPEQQHFENTYCPDEEAIPTTVTHHKNNTAIRLDEISRKAFPTVFIIFTIGYWLFFKFWKSNVL